MTALATSGIILSLTPLLKIVGEVVVLTSALPEADSSYMPVIKDLKIDLFANTNSKLIGFEPNPDEFSKLKNVDNKKFYEELRDNSAKGWKMDTCTSEIISEIKTNTPDNKFKNRNSFKFI